MRRLEWWLGFALLAGCASGGGDKAEPTKATANTASRLSAAGRMNLGLAQGYLEAGDVAKARLRAEQAVQTDPGSAEVRAMLGMIHSSAGETEKAQREFDRAVQIAPADGAILNAHAVWSCEHGQAELADREFAKALLDSRYRTPAQALSNAGKCALSVGRLAPAEDYLRRAMVFAPDDRNLLYLLAETEFKQGKFFEARAFVQRRDAQGADARTLDLAARIEAASGDAMATARYRQRLHQEFPDYVPTGEGARSP